MEKEIKKKVPSWEVFHQHDIKVELLRINMSTLNRLLEHFCGTYLEKLYNVTGFVYVADSFYL